MTFEPGEHHAIRAMANTRLLVVLAPVVAAAKRCTNAEPVTPRSPANATSERIQSTRSWRGSRGRLPARSARTALNGASTVLGRILTDQWRAGCQRDEGSRRLYFESANVPDQTYCERPVSRRPAQRACSSPDSSLRVYGQMRSRGSHARTVRAASFVQRHDGGSGSFDTRWGRAAPIRSASAST